MRPSRARSLALVPFLVGLFSLAAPALPDDAKPAAPPAPTVEELVADLGHPVYATRERAQRELWKRGDAAIPALEKVLTSDDPEVVRRARELLDKFAWGIRPDTPPEVMKLLRQFQAGDKDPQKSAEVRKSAILDLLRHGTPGASVAKALLGKPLPDEARAQVVTQVTAVLRREVPRLLFAGKTAEAAELVALHTAGTGPEGAADYAAFQILAKTLPAATSAAETGLKLGRNSANHKLILAHLYRAAGDWPKARAAAADLPQPEGQPPLTEHLREEEGDWAKLADSGYFGSMNHPSAVRLTLLRLAGRNAEFDEEAKTVAKEANEFSTRDEIFEAVVALLSNHRADDATRILMDKKQNLGLLGEVLIQRLRYKEALELARDDAGRSPREKLELDLRRARILLITGNRGEAVQLFNKVADGLLATEKDGNESVNPIVSVRSLIRTEMRVGLKDLAAEHAAKFVHAGTFKRHEDSATGESAFELLINQDAIAAEAIYYALRQANIPGKEPGPTMMRVRDLLIGKVGKVGVDEALAAIRNWRGEEILSTEGRPPAPLPECGADEPSQEFRCKQQLAIAAVCRAANRDADAEVAFKAAAELASDNTNLGGARSWVYGTSDDSRPYVEWGDFLYDRGRYRDAAEAYLAGWKKFPDQPLPMLLSGKALVKVGDVKEGERRLDLAHWVSLGQERVRGRFIDELVRRAEGRAARRECDLMLRACWSRDHYFGNVMNQVARAMAMVKDFAAAEKASQRSLLILLKSQGMYFVETSAYMVSPHETFVYHVRGAFAAGKTDEAVAMAREVLAVTPGHVEIVSGLVPGLEKLGKKAEANELFGIGWKAYRKVLADYPDSPSARNSLALLAANCRRELDKGLEYAREAVKADPASPPYRETLAEVHFRRGERESAVAVMTKLIEDDPRNRLYKRQLNRYRSGALDSPKPETED